MQFTWAKTQGSPGFTRYSVVYLGKDPHGTLPGQRHWGAQHHKVKCSLPGRRSPRVLYLGKDTTEPRLHKVQCSLPGQRPQGPLASQGTVQFTWAKPPEIPDVTRYSVVYLGKAHRYPRPHTVQCSLPGQRYPWYPGFTSYGVVYLGKDPRDPPIHTHTHTRTRTHTHARTH